MAVLASNPTTDRLSCGPASLKIEFRFEDAVI
jgi:hypothetical protein